MKTRLITIHKNINQALTTKRGNKMGYAVSYKRSGRPTSRRAKRQSPANKAQRTKDMKNAIRWNVAQLEHDTTGTDSIERGIVCKLLHLGKIAPTADPTGDHVLQQLISEGYVQRPRKRAGVQVFDRADLLTSLKAYAGMC